MSKNMKDWTPCAKCNRGGNGNDKDKCACGWHITEINAQGCFVGTPIVGDIKPKPQLTRSQKRYQRYIKYGDLFESFRQFLGSDLSKKGAT